MALNTFSPLTEKVPTLSLFSTFSPLSPHPIGSNKSRTRSLPFSLYQVVHSSLQPHLRRTSIFSGELKRLKSPLTHFCFCFVYYTQNLHLFLFRFLTPKSISKIDYKIDLQNLQNEIPKSISVPSRFQISKLIVRFKIADSKSIDTKSKSIFKAIYLCVRSEGMCALFDFDFCFNRILYVCVSIDLCVCVQSSVFVFDFDICV